MSSENLEWKYLTIGGAPLVQNPNKTYVLKVVDTEPEPIKKPIKKMVSKTMGKIKVLFDKILCHYFRHKEIML